MASVIQLPSAPNTGLSTLGNVLYSSASDYADKKRADELEARRRSERLADIQSERAYQDTNYNRARSDKLSDIQSERNYNDQEKALALTRELVRLGFLQPEDLKDDTKVAEAFVQFGQSALASRYKDALESGALSYADLGDPERVQAGLLRYSDVLEKSGKFKQGLPEQAKTRIDQLAVERQSLLNEAQTLNNKLAEPEPQPDPQAVRALAFQIAKASMPKGKPPGEADIAAAEADARKQIGTQLLVAWDQQRRDAMIQRQGIVDRLRDVSSETNTITNRFGVVGVAPDASPTPVNAAPTTRAPDLATAQKSFADTIAAELAKARAAKPATGTPAQTTPTDYTYQGGLLGGAERAVPLISSAASRLAEIPGNFDRAFGAIGTGLMTGDYSTPRLGGLGQIGESIGTSLSDIFSEGEKRVEDEILRTDPNSDRAKSIRARRGLPPMAPTPVGVAPLQSIGGQW